MVSDFAPGNYRFIPAVFQYSSGVAASPGFEIERVCFDKWLPLAEGFARIASYVQAAGRPLTSFCACELRSPAAFTEAGFRPSTSITSRRSQNGDCSTAPPTR